MKTADPPKFILRKRHQLDRLAAWLKQKTYNVSRHNRDMPRHGFPTIELLQNDVLAASIVVLSPGLFPDVLIQVYHNQAAEIAA